MTLRYCSCFANVCFILLYYWLYMLSTSISGLSTSAFMVQHGLAREEHASLHWDGRMGWMIQQSFNVLYS